MAAILAKTLGLNRTKAKRSPFELQQIRIGYVMELSLLVQVVMEAYRYEPTSFEMPSWGSVSF